jgi:hypothetical protein
MSEPSFTCPVCGRKSFHPQDVAERWCNACHWATGYPPPVGHRMILFVGGGSLDNVGRLIPELGFEEGSEYVLASSGERYVYDNAAGVYRFAGR